jgi:rhodanese-related sulfurtransferase
MLSSLRPWVTSALCVLALHTGCSDNIKWSAVESMIQANFGDVPQITTDSLAARLAAQRDMYTADVSSVSDSSLLSSTQQLPVLLLDARQQEEYAVSHLPGAVRVDPSATTFPELDSLSRERSIVVYCSVGYRSAQVTKRLREHGYAASNLRGSIFRWANEGRPVVRGDSVVREVHPYNDTWGDLLRLDLRAYTPGNRDSLGLP